MQYKTAGNLDVVVSQTTRISAAARQSPVSWRAASEGGHGKGDPVQVAIDVYS